MDTTNVPVRPQDARRPADELTLCHGCDRLAWRMHGVPVARWCDDCARRIAADDDREAMASAAGSMW